MLALADWYPDATEVVWLTLSAASRRLRPLTFNRSQELRRLLWIVGVSPSPKGLFAVQLLSDVFCLFIETMRAPACHNREVPGGETQILSTISVY